MSELQPQMPELFGSDSAIYELSASFLKYHAEKEERKYPVAVHFNSRDRARDVYPYASHFRIKMPIVLNDVQRLSLPALEFTNTSMSVHEKNNVIRWINANDDHVYSAKVNVGIYTLTTLTTEILRAMNAVPRRTSDSNHHFTASTVDNPQNGITFYNIVASDKGVSDDPLSTTADSSSITIHQTAHAIEVGDTVWLYGISGGAGGIPDDVLNGSQFTVSAVIDQDSFTITSQVVPYISGDGGGPDVMIGRATFFRFVEDTDVDVTTYVGKNLLQLLGFPPISCLLLRDVLSVPNLHAFLLSSYTHFGNFDNIVIPRLDQLGITFSTGDQLQFIGADMLGIHKSLNFIVTQVNTQYMVLSLSADIAFINDLFNLLQSRADAIANLPIQQKTRLGITTSGPHSISFAKTQSNIYDTGTTYAAADVSGEAYCYIVSPQLNTCNQQMIAHDDNVMRTSRNNGAILSKIQLTATAGYIDFNKALPIDTSWSKGKEISLEYIDVQLVDTHQQPLSFQDLEYSGTLQIYQAPPKCPALLRQITNLNICD